MSYDAASKKVEQIKGYFNCMIADEAHYLKSKDS